MDKRNSIPSIDVLHRVFSYNDGLLYWKEKTAACVKIGSKVGVESGRGYLIVPFQYKHYYVHRIIFMMQHGYVPHIIDHIDGNRSNNKIENLRPATRSENCRNQKTPKNNTSGYKNVFWHKTSKKWKVALSVDGKLKHIGSFSELEAAKISAHEARIKYHQDFAKHE